MMNCKQIENLREDYLAGELPEAQKLDFLTHLSQCPHCKRKTAQEEDLIQSLKGLPAYNPGEDLLRKTRRKIFSTRPQTRWWIFDFLAEHQSQMFNWGVAVTLTLLVFLNTKLYFNQQHVASVAPVAQKSETPPPHTVKFVLNVEAEEQQVKTVSVVGDFNGWDPNANKMQYDKKEGAWKLDLQLKTGTYDYMYVINDKVWMPDPSANKLRDDGFGGKNSVLEL